MKADIVYQTIILCQMSGLEVCIPECHFLGTGFFPKNLGNFLSRAFGNILFPVPTQYQHSGLASSHLVVGQETFQSTSKLKLIILISALLKTFPTGTDLFIKFSTRQYFPDESHLFISTLTPSVVPNGYQNNLCCPIFDSYGDSGLFFFFSFFNVESPTESSF